MSVDLFIDCLNAKLYIKQEDRAKYYIYSDILFKN